MLKKIIQEFRPAISLFMLLTLVTGVLYPYFVTGVAQAFFAPQANGSLIERDGQVVGSSLIGQAFSAPHYFSGRPSGTGPMAYNASASSGANLAASNPALREAAQARIELQQGTAKDSRVPVDLVATSASGLDPEISLAAAQYQVARIATVRLVKREKISALIDQYQQSPILGFLGEPRVNVLRLNLALDAQFPVPKVN